MEVTFLSALEDGSPHTLSVANSAFALAATLAPGTIAS